MVESADYDDATAAAVAIGATNLVGTGLARESGGNLDTHTGLLRGTAAGALIANIGATIGQEVAAQIATGSAAGTPGGAPLLHGAKQVYTNTFTILPSTTTAAVLITFTRPGYLIRIGASNPAGGPAAFPYIKADVEWQVAAQGNVDADEQWWYFNVGNNNTHRTNGKGPVIGDTMRLRLTNPDNTFTTTVSVNIWETTHAPARHDWRDTGGVPSASGTFAASAPQAGLLADINVSVPGATTTQLNLPLYAGQVNLWMNQNATAGSKVLLVPQAGFDFPQGEPMITLDWTALANVYEGIILPRCPCAFLVTNANAAARSILATLTTLEYAT